MYQERLRRRLGASMRFNAATSYIRLGVQPRLDRGARTYACLCYVAGIGEGGAGTLFSQTGPGTTINGPRWVVDDNSGNPVLSLRTTSSGSSQFPARNSASASVAYGNVYLFVSTWDGGLTATNMRHYAGLNGAAPAEMSYGSTANGTGSVTLNSTFDTYIGNRQDGDRTFNGDIFYLSVWDRIITPQDIRDLWAFGPLAVEGGLLVYGEHEDFGLLGITARATVDVIPGSMPRGVSEIELGERPESMLGGVRIDATAAGTTRSVGSSIIAGSASAASTASGLVLPVVTVTLQAGAASGGGNATAGGVTLVVSSSLVPGTAAANSSVAGVTVGPAVSMINGSASASSTAPGATIVVTTSLQAGAASGGGSATAAGVTLAVGASLVPGSATAASTAAGVVMGPTITLQPGSASGAGNAVAGGVTLTVAQSFIAGAVAAAAQAQGALRTITASLISGAAYGPGAPPAEPGNVARTPARRRTVYYGKD